MFVRMMASLLVAAGLACTTSPTGRQQLRIFSDAQMTQLGVTAYDQMKTEIRVSDDVAALDRVRCIADALTAEIVGHYARIGWEVTVFDDATPNAFALPGGKIGVHTGLFQVARNQSQLATVMGHEVAHVLADHGNERVSTQFAAQSGLELVKVMSGSASPAQQQLMGALGLGAQVGVLLPFSRAQEREADLIGLDLMAKAGFDPRESVTLWKNMAEAGGAQPVEFLSTHPSHGTRIRDLEARIPSALQYYQSGLAMGRSPECD